MAKLKLADTLLAKWLVGAMASWVDPETHMPGMSQHKLARLSGVSQAQVHEILKKGHAPRPDSLNKLASLFGVHPVRLYVLAYLGEEDIDLEFWNAFFELKEHIDQLPPDQQERARGSILEAMIEWTPWWDFRSDEDDY